MNWPSARSSRGELAPQHDEPRAGRACAARAKSMPERVRRPPRAGAASNAKLRGSPQRRSSTLWLSSGPSGTSSARTLGNVGQQRVEPWPGARAALLALLHPSLSAAISASSSGDGVSPRALEPGRSRARGGCGSPGPPAAASRAARRSASSSSTAAAAGGWPRRPARHRRRRGCSRSQRRSIMAVPPVRSVRDGAASR